jgi:DNA-binding NarL/FixJ family response regulator
MRVVVADDETLFRHMLVNGLRAQGIEVVGEAVSEPELLTVVHATTPDVVLTDLRMPKDDRDAGLRAAIRIRHETPAVGVILLSKYGEAEYASELLRELPDRVGYILKDRVNTIPELVS